ncbi:AI-2E family transporter [Schumannella luteola]|uniref:Putative PurR-regulated permease PerM n=1 Tax=Schumannella luteola TaxID=472059 RepID=A0A852Y8X9_9MICO|nr:AI-2E family transporter [Schumannella luteola]NYG99416.1 putative PurR-regulated permease PerM [Schumannella luteola]
MAVFRSRDERRNDALRRETLDSVSPGMRIAAAWSWRILVVAAALALFGFLVVQLRMIVVPLLVAVVLAALLVPFKNWLQRHGWPKALAVAVSEIGVIAVIGGLLTLVVLQIRSGYPALEKRTKSQYDALTDWLHGPPFNLSDKDIAGYIDQAWKAIQADSSNLLSGALDVGSTAGHFLAGVLIVLFSTLFVLIDGGRIFAWLVRLFPKKARDAVRGAGQAGWLTLTRFVKVQIFVAFVDAVGIGLGAWILGLFYGGFPLVIPIAVAVFLGSFIPVVGAVVSGVLAVFVALVFLGPFPAILMLAIVILVQQIEGHVLQPFVMGTAVKVHPLAVVLGVAAGGFIAGIPGAFFAVPLIATLNVMIGYVARGEWRTNPHPELRDVTTDVR